MKMLGKSFTSERYQTFVSKDSPNKNKLEATTFLFPKKKAWGEAQAGEQAAHRSLSVWASVTTGQAVYTGCGRSADGGVVSLGNFIGQMDFQKSSDRDSKGS